MRLIETHLECRSYSTRHLDTEMVRAFCEKVQTQECAHVDYYVMRIIAAVNQTP